MKDELYVGLMLGAGARARGARAVPMSGCERDVLGNEHRENLGLGDPAMFLGRANPLPECSCTSRRGGWLGSSVGGGETKGKFSFLCNNHLLKKIIIKKRNKKERENFPEEKVFYY